MSKEILCTLGPASMNERVIARLEELGVTLFRINLSHTSIEDLPSAIAFIQGLTKVPLSLDTEGAQIRTGQFAEGPVMMRENTVVRAHLNRVPGDAKDFNFYPLDIIKAFQPGDFISIDFNAVLVQVINHDPDSIVMRVINGGLVDQNKAVTLDRDIAMPALTEKDRKAIKIGLDLGIRHYALSFANRSADVAKLRSMVGKDAEIISKIECLNGVTFLDEIADQSDALLIDRGDLSRQFPIEQIPRLQKRIIKQAKKAGRKVYVATNLLESMVSDPAPTRAEVNDIYNTFLDGADGLVLAAETAVGNYPVRCADMVIRMIKEFEKQDQDDVSLHDPVSLLVEPHGGTLVHRQAQPSDLAGVEKLPALEVSETDLLDCTQFADGSYSPLTGFMDSRTLESVLAEHHLPDGTVWTMPIVLQVPEDEVKGFGPGDRVRLTSGEGTVHALLDTSEIYSFDFESVAGRWFGTDSRDHPGVQRLARGGNRFVAGDVTLVERPPSPYRYFELTPSQTRFIFAHKSWSRVVGFHTRNAAHRAHEYIQLEALERTGADGLFISPVIGAKKSGDFLPGPIMKSYQALLEFGIYPEGKVVLGSFATYPRYCGPREAVFTALCRKNMGCNCFIIGRDHTGVGDYYAPGANEALFQDLGDMGITPVFFDAIGYDLETGAYDSFTRGRGMETISGCELRKKLREGQSVPDWCMRDVVQDVLREEIAAGHEIFVR